MSELLLVMFADISDSSQLYEALGDGAARHKIAGCLATLMAIIKRHNGRVIKTMGDEVMGVFSTVEEGVAAACEMHTSLERERLKQKGSHLSIHVGMHYGPVLLDGSDVFGDTVNMAKRLAEIARVGQIITTQSVVGKLSERLRASTRRLDCVPVKGKKDLIEIFEVIWQAQDRRSKPAGLANAVVLQLAKDKACALNPCDLNLN